MSTHDPDRQPQPGDVDVRISFPTRSAHTDKAVTIEITDGPSRSRIIEIDLTAEQYVALMSGSTAHATGAWLPSDKGWSRIGKRMETASATFGYGKEAEANAQADDYRADGWEAAEVRRSNSGFTVVARRWVASTD